LSLVAPAATDKQTLTELIGAALSGPARPRAFAERLGRTEWTYVSSSRMLERARAIAYALRDAGIERGDRVVLISENRLDWIAADFGILFAGAVVVPIFATIALDQCDYIFKDSGAKLVFVESQAELERVRGACPNTPRTIAFDAEGPDSLAAFEARGAELAAADPERSESFTAGVSPDDLAVLIYTSGTTGNPKGVILSHDNLTWDSKVAFDYGFKSIERGSDVLSVLPYAHIYEHNVLLGIIGYQGNVHVTQPDYLVADLKSVRPVVMTLVPRIFERVLAVITTRAKSEGGAKAKLIPWALAVGREYAAARAGLGKSSPTLGLRYALAKKLVLSKIPPTLGLDRMKFLVSGSAALHRDISLTFHGLGIPVCEGYGLTETSPTVTVNTADRIKYGSVGRAIPGVELKIAGDGEILVRGRNVMKGYFHVESEQPFTEDGWFKTGDIGEIDDEGFLFITDRKKELFKTSTGKYVAPGRVEAAIKRSVYVGQAFVMGDGRPYPIALVTPNWDLIRKDFSIPDTTSTLDIAKRDDVRNLVQKEVAEKTGDLASFEQIRRIALLPRDLTIEDGELSPTMKIKRRVVEKKFSDVIEGAYLQSSRS
jgi:long-chain acyl-CoA synthetase